MSVAPERDRDQSRLLTSAEAAARLGVKPQTLYAYVSRGLVHRTVALDGRSSLFDPVELDALRRSKNKRRRGELQAVIASAITLVDDDGLLLRGEPLVERVAAAPAGHRFTTVADALWQAQPLERWPDLDAAATSNLGGIDGLRTIVAGISAGDAMRNDLDPSAVRNAGRRTITAMACGLEPVGRGSDRDLVAALWRRLTSRRSNAASRDVLDTALALLVDHGLASSTFAARIAASVRADAYSVISAGLGALGGSLHGAASAGVHEMLDDAATLDDPAAAVARRLHPDRSIPGFGHTVYTREDPRYTALMARIVEAWADDPRLQTLFRVRDVVAERRSDLANIDLALGALTWLAGMAPTAGEIIFAIARSAGWLAHAIEEYSEAPLRLRPQARYTGAR